MNKNIRKESIAIKIFKQKDIIGKNRISLEIKELWKETFGDTDHYINLLYDTYLNDSLICIAEVEIPENSMNGNYQTQDRVSEKSKKIIAALTAIPYQFGENRIRGWYLCGLSTVPDLRGRGIMGKMMKMTEEAICQMGDRLIFLIPADSRLEKYYMRKGFSAGKLRTKLEIPCYINLGEGASKDSFGIENTDCSTSPKIGKIHWSELTEEDRERLIKFLIKSEREDLLSSNEVSEPSLSLYHSQRDWMAIVRENEISGGYIYLCRLMDSDEISAVAFIYEHDESAKRGINNEEQNGEDVLPIQISALREKRENNERRNQFSPEMVSVYEDRSGEYKYEIRKIIGSDSAKKLIIDTLWKRGRIILYLYTENEVQSIFDLLQRSYHSEARIKEDRITSVENTEEKGVINDEMRAMMIKMGGECQEERYIMVKELSCEKTDEGGNKIPEITQPCSDSENLILSIKAPSELKYPIFREGNHLLSNCQLLPNRISAWLLLD